MIKLKTIKRKGVRRYIFELFIKHLGAVGYAIQGLLDGLVLHIIFWIIQYVESIFVVHNNSIVEKAIQAVSVLDYISIIICTVSGIINLAIHLFHETRREQVKEDCETQKAKNKYGSLPGKTASIAEKLAEDIDQVEVEDGIDE